MSDNILSLKDVHMHVGQYHILQGVNMDVPKQGLTMLLGRNGAGKTSTMRTIMGLWKASAGSVQFDGSAIEALQTPAIARMGVSYVPENMGIFSSMTVHENMVLAAKQGDFDKARLDWIYDLFPALKKFWQLAAGNLSGGQKQMLAIARSIIEPRKLLLIDEPTKGLAPAIIDSLIEAFLQLKRTDTTILMVEQNFRMAKAVGDTVAVMDDGKIVHTGAMSELSEDEGLQQRLLGLSMDLHQ